jgi:hypothetical protein
MGKGDIIQAIIRLRDEWYATERLTLEDIWGECAYELDSLIEKIADQK